MRHYVYQHWDKEGNLLYIGATRNIVTRSKSHQTSPWFSLIASISHKIHPNMEEALAEEKRLIEELAPPYNIQYHPINQPKLIAQRLEKTRPQREEAALKKAEVNRLKEEAKAAKALEKQREKAKREEEARIAAENAPRRKRESADFYVKILSSMYVDLYFLSKDCSYCKPVTIEEAILSSVVLQNALKAVVGMELTREDVRRAIFDKSTNSKALSYDFATDSIRYNHYYSTARSAMYYCTNLWSKFGDQMVVRVENYYPGDEELDIHKEDFFFLMSTLYGIYLIHCQLEGKTPENTQNER